ncbi:enhancer of mRNA-decapping protein 4-like [Liolophura sinensis]|uniref:enhancer of mRNA-decapping protein 4-like n=1 Tax=Liolophura sinensis TaxID=3198878 RepID=UPI0031596356
MDAHQSASSSLNSSDASQLLKELLNVGKSTGSSLSSLHGATKNGNFNLNSSHEGSGDASSAQTLTELMKTMYNSVPRQQILLTGDDNVNSFSVYGKEVDIVASSTSNVSHSSAGSNKVKIVPVVNYDWEHRRYVGSLVTTHRASEYVAYVLKGKSGGIVRIINSRSAERALLKDFTGRVIDIAFAHTDEVMLAAVDEIGNLFVYEIEENEDRKLITTLVLHVTRPAGTKMSDFHRVIWCPYIPEDGDDSTTEGSVSDVSKILVLTHDEKAEIWSVDIVGRDMGIGPIDPETVQSGKIFVNSHTQPIMDAAFSPDGSALATASLDGEVKFFQVYMHEGTNPRCLHQWKPHDGKPMSYLAFLDDHKNPNLETQFWKYAVTGANNNQEIKIWSCESWNCLQTIRFLEPPNLPTNFHVEPSLKACLDLSAKYLVLTDIKRKVLYVLQLFQDNEAGMAHVSSISEFLLTQPCLSLSIYGASTKKFKKSPDDSHMDEITTGEIEADNGAEEEDGPETEDKTTGVQIKIFSVHTKALQNLEVRFIPHSSTPQPPPPSISSVSQDETGLRDLLSDMSLDNMTSDSDASKDMLQPVLLTPDAFTTSQLRRDAGESSVQQSTSTSSSFTQVTGMNEDLYSVQSLLDQQTILTPDSSLTMTPSSTKEFSPATSHNLTPSSVPLPPISSSEERDLATPQSSRSTHSTQSLPSRTDMSPRSSAPQPQEQTTVDDLFMGEAAKHSETIASVGASTSSSVDPVDLGASLTTEPKVLAPYDENDEEVAGVMAEVEEVEIEEEDESSEEDEGGMDVDVKDSKESEDGQGEDVAESLEESSEERPPWPKPPTVGSEAQRLATEAIDQGALEIDEPQEAVEEHETSGEERGDLYLPTPTTKAKDSELRAASPLICTSLPQGRQPRPSGSRKEEEVQVIKEVIDREALRELQEGLAQVLGLLKAQQQEVNSLHLAVQEQQDQQTQFQKQVQEQQQLQQVAMATSAPNMDEQLGKLENVMGSRVERLLTHHAQRENQRLQEVLRLQQMQEHQRQEQLMNSVNQTLTVSLPGRIEKVVRQEMKNTITPHVSRVLEPMKDQFHQDVAQKLTATDALLKDSIGKMVRSRATVEAVGTAAGNAIQAPLAAAYREIFHNTVVPSFERATQMMYQQINETFQRGSKEYSVQLESHLEKLRKKHLESRDPIIHQLNALVETFQTTANKIESQVVHTVQTEVQSQLDTSLTSFKEKLLSHVRDVVKEEVNAIMKEQSVSLSDTVVNAVRSSAATPVPMPTDPQQQQEVILSLLQQGQLNAAFQKALSASNLDLVMFVCDTVIPSQVFNQSPCPLQQPVLLSLIQQLSAELGQNTELKHKYLEEAVMNLDTSHPVTQEHMQGVLYGLCQKLKQFIQANPTEKSAKSLRMLLMASQSLLKQ